MQNNNIFNFIRIPDWISLGNGICGGISILLSIKNYNALFPAGLILAGGILDFFDGRIARKHGLASDFGKNLDSLCDIVTFIVAPVVFALIYIDGLAIWEMAILIFYIAAGLLRLARFNVTGTLSGGKYFEGMPVPFSIVLIFLYFPILMFSLPMTLWIVLFLLHGCLMISTVRIRKL
ncbi:MAG: CDP-alcohol phosphatidyltransferase family protein [Sporocytophaga sp.]|uniref:CDP-alcohol phosphatidyltransferase family protein n=1 Tax=Sporocytophaga sp. TaxID=2231183 RepID=UPI001B161C1E|nr:CDP-alcohol phosphatidyltransferase family protein [Sporocytophaga sp.]MBO9702064.1 CDP-alcohol phosphatidyltransferase family protein [Sporocytophaga sp.]